MSNQSQIPKWNEPALIRKTVADISMKLSRMSSYEFKDLIGIEHHIVNIKALLSLESPDVRIVGIWGLGGVGKTTLAEVIFHDLKAKFDSYSFVANIRQQLERTSLDQLVNKCLSHLLDNQGIGTYDIRDSWVRDRLGRNKILLILDDVDNFMHANYLEDLRDLFGPRSRIIITSRDIKVHRIIGTFRIYHVSEMSFDNALLLFSLKAFKQNNPPKSHLQLSKSVVDYCGGIPLALKVLGCYLRGSGEEEWKSAMEDLKQGPHEAIFNVLKLSYDGLNDMQKNIFLDLACFFAGRDNWLFEESIKKFYDYSSDFAISVLKERSLISIDKCGQIVMHDLIVAMGKEIAHQQFINGPKKVIRLWKHEDIYQFLRNNKGIGKIRGMSLDMCRIKTIFVRRDVFQKMYQLRILDFYKSDPRESSKVYIYEGLEILLEELRILHWEEFPLTSLPLSFCAENLARLEMPKSNLQNLWDGDQHFPNLEVIDLSGSKLLIELPDLCQAPNIKEIMLDDCVNLLQINSSESLVRLKTLVLDRCKKIRSAEILNFCNQLSSLYWEQCPLKSLPLSCLRNLIDLVMPKSKLEQLWDGRQYFPQLEVIELRRSKYLTQMPDLSQTPNIFRMNLDGCTSLLQLYSSGFLSNLRSLWLNGCSKLRRENIRSAPCTLKSLSLPSTPSKLFDLSMTNSKVERLWDGNGHFSKLEEIDVRECKHLTELPTLSQTPNIETIYVDGCVNLLQIHSSSTLLQLQRLWFNGCNKLRRVNLFCNVHPRSSRTLEIACNYFDLKNLTFNEVCIRFFLSNDGNIYAFGFKVASLEFTKMWNCMHVAESGQLKLLGQSLPSLLPFVQKLHWFDITSSIEWECFTNHYASKISPNMFVKEFTKIQLLKSGLDSELERSLGKECTIGTKNKGEAVVEEGMGPKNLTKLNCDYICDTIKGTTVENVGSELEEKLIREVECCSSNRLTRSPNNITRWLLSTDLSLQKTVIMNVQRSIPGFSFLKALAKSNCSRLQPMIDLIIPVNVEILKFAINFSEELSQRDSNSAYFVTIKNVIYFRYQ